MKKFIAAAGIAAGLIVASAAPALATHEDSDKVTICHWANGNAHEITISVNALDGHFHLVGGILLPIPGHEHDSLGACPAAGPQGDPGHDGSNGHDGKDGVDGKDGSNGKDGKDGSNGSTPLAVCLDGGVYFVTDSEAQLPEGAFFVDVDHRCFGPAGQDGANGNDGSNGSDGTSGLNGVDGASGSSGKDGSNGVDGKDGALGPQGNQGYTACADGSITGLGGTCTVTTTEVAGETISKAPAAPVTGELPHTGAGETFVLFGAALGLIGLGLGFRSLRHKNAS